MIYLSESTMQKYNAGYRKASTILAEYLPENNKATEKLKLLFEKANGKEDLQEITECSKPEKLDFYKLKPLNLQRRKGLITATHTPKKDFQKIGIITLSGNVYGKVLGYLYQDKNGNKYMIPEKEHRSLFGL